MARSIAWLREIQSTVDLARDSLGGPSQYLGEFPRAEPGVVDPHLRGYQAAGETLGRNPVEGYREIEALAHGGSVLSMLFVADALRKGDGYERDLEKAQGWYSHAASFGSGRAMYGMGLIHLSNGDIEKAIEALELAGARSCGAALWCLGLIYDQGGYGVSRDVDSARALLERGAALGHVWSSRTLALLLMSGRYGIGARLRGYATYLTGFVATTIAISAGSTDRVMR